MTGIQSLKQAVYTRYWALVLVALAAMSCESKDHDSRGRVERAPAASPSAKPGSTEEADTPSSPDGSCKPKCGADCGADDGCGKKCGCADGLECEQGVCVDRACGPCRPNERCHDGKCECVPDCEGHACEADGCGGKCDCPTGTVINAAGKPVPVEECKDTCKQAGWTCGELCGVDCGECGAGLACKRGSCECEPKCDGTSCSDGCGGSCDCDGSKVCNAQQACVGSWQCKDTCESTGKTCGSICGVSCGSCGDGQSCIDGQCREGVSCADCNLQLRLLDRTVLNDKIVRVKLGVDFQANSEGAGPRLVDLRIAADRVVSLTHVEAGPALLGSGKDLFVDESTQLPFQEKPDDSYQLLAYGISGTLRVQSGRMIELTFDMAEAGPVRFTLLRHLQTFAPLESDNVLQASSYDQSLVVSR